MDINYSCYHGSEEFVTLFSDEFLANPPPTPGKSPQEQLMEMRVFMPTYTAQPNKGHMNMTLCVTKPMMHPVLYSGVTSMIMAMKKGDEANIYFHTPGGSVTIAQMLIHACEHTQGNVIGHAIGDVISAGTLGFQACHEYRVSPTARFMFHSSRASMQGKTSTLQTYTYGHLMFLARIFDGIVGKGFLTKEERDRVVDGVEDVYISGADIIKRLALHGTDKKCVFKSPEVLPTDSDKNIIELTGGV